MGKAAPLQGVEPALLKWARETAHMTVEDAAQMMNKSEADIVAWEQGTSAPSYSQLEKLAYKLYKRPLVYFFLPYPPEEDGPEAKFRALPDADLRNLSRDTVFLIRRAQAYQESLIELFDDKSPIKSPLWRRVRLDFSKSTTSQAASVRRMLKVHDLDSDDWKKFNDDDALKYWRKTIEANGIFVFKHAFEQKNISGFCLEHPELPIILINNSTTKTRQIFSLLHELAHILMKRSAISKFDDAVLEKLPSIERKIEIFCNLIAAEILVPSKDFDSQHAVQVINDNNLKSEHIEKIAARYLVSREVILRRLLDKELVIQSTYKRLKNEWDNQLKTPQKPGGNTFYNINTYISDRLKHVVFNKYHRHQISIAQAADYMCIAPKQVDGLENVLLEKS